MPPRQGADQHNVTLPETIGAQLALLASDPAYGSKSRVVEASLRLLVEGDASQALVNTVQQQLSAFQAKVLAQLDTVDNGLTMALAKLNELDTRLKRMEDREAHRHEEVTSAYDRLARKLPDPSVKTGFWGKVSG